MKKTSQPPAKARKGLAPTGKPAPASAPAGKTNIVTKSSPTQLQTFESAMKLFHSRDFAGALNLFEQAAAGSAREIAHAARQRINMCNQRLGNSQPQLKTIEEICHYAGVLIAARKLDEADLVLRTALDKAPGSDQVHYTAGLCKGLKGDLPAAARHFEQAIRLDPRNISVALSDPDFLEFGRQSPVREVVFQGKKEAE